MTVREIMTTAVVSVGPRDRVRDALALLYDNDIRQVPVVSEDGIVVGIVTDRDLRSHIGTWLGDDLDPEDRHEAMLDRVEEVMTENPVTVDPELTLPELIDVMVSTKYGGLPVVDATGRLQGIVTYIDVLREVRGRL